MGPGREDKLLAAATASSEESDLADRSFGNSGNSKPNFFTPCLTSGRRVGRAFEAAAFFCVESSEGPG